MMQIVSTRKNIAVVVFNIGDEIYFTPLEKYNPNMLDARSPKFNGTFDQCVRYIHEVI